MAVDLDHDHIAHCKTQREEDAVPAKRKRTESGDFGINTPNQVIQGRLPHHVERNYDTR